MLERMPQIRPYLTLVSLVFLAVLLACSPKHPAQQSIYHGLGPSEDGVVAAAIEEETFPTAKQNQVKDTQVVSPAKKANVQSTRTIYYQLKQKPNTPVLYRASYALQPPNTLESNSEKPAQRELGKIGHDQIEPTSPTPSEAESEFVVQVDRLTAQERQLINKFHRGQESRISFIVADAEKRFLFRSYLAREPRVLASTTKIATALAALENLKDIKVNDVAQMLKASDNSKASFYVRQVAKQLDNVAIPGQPFAGKASCPGRFDETEVPAGQSVLGWVKREANSSENFALSSLNDGSGCHYGNRMTGEQMVHLLDYADSRKKRYDGKSFEELLSIAGKDGTWRSHNKESKGLILAKTGTLNIASNLAGYFYVRRGDQLDKYYFAIFVRNEKAGEATESRKLIEALVRLWISEIGTSQIQFDRV